MLESRIEFKKYFIVVGATPNVPRLMCLALAGGGFPSQGWAATHLNPYDEVINVRGF